MEKSQSIKEIASALVKFQEKMEAVKKDSSNPFFKSKYADLSGIIEAIKKPLSENGLSFSQHPTGKNELTTILMHTSGEFIQSTYEMTPSKNDPQGLGSAITYQRRYALGAILGIATEEDDDGNKASTPAKVIQKTPSIEEMKKVVLQKIEASKTIDSLTMIDEKVQSSNKYDAVFKKSVKDRINDKIEDMVSA